MNTQGLLFERSGEIPEGLYVELMNKLKTDFINNEQQSKTLIVILSKNIPKKIVMSKEELIQQIIKKSVDWEDREEVLIKINRMSYWVLKDYCIIRSVPIIKVNPRWIEQERLIQNHGTQIDFFRTNSPSIINIQ